MVHRYRSIRHSGLKNISTHTSISMLPLIPSDPGCPFTGRMREAFCDGFVDERRMADELYAAPSLLLFGDISSAKGDV